jgi:hypothetical protein
MQNDIVYKIIAKLNLDPNKQLKRAIRGYLGYTTLDLIASIVSTSSINETAELLGYSNNPIKQSIREVLLPLFPERSCAFSEHTGSHSWKHALLAKIDHKQCWNCKRILPYTAFYKDSDDTIGISGDCSSCHTHRTKLQKIDIAKRTPNWADLTAIRKFYNNCPKGMHVDHIIPLRGKYVSGLHIVSNLQYLTPEENLAKSNTYIV